MNLLDPKTDFIFKNIFGSEKHPRVLISFLNAVLKPVNLISSVELKETDITPESLEDKYSRLDVKAVTNKGEHINIEIQLRNEYNMTKRSLYYLSKMYSDQLHKGEDYNSLDKTVCINILDFKYLHIDKYHSSYRFKEVEDNVELTDVLEVHFIEIPKLPEDADVKDVLVAWVEFLKDPDSPRVRELEFTLEEIKEAKDELIKISQDGKQRALYEIREKASKDRTSALAQAKREGRGEVIERMLKDGMTLELIVKYTGATLQEIEEIEKQL